MISSVVVSVASAVLVPVSLLVCVSVSSVYMPLLRVPANSIFLLRIEDIPF